MTGLRSATFPARPGAGGDRTRRDLLRSSVVTGLRLSAVVGLLIAGYALAPWDRWVGLSGAWQLAVWLVVIVLAVVWQIRAVMRSPHPWVRAVEGAVLSVALLLLPLAAAYERMSQAVPASFTQPLDRVDAGYFTVTVFATVGFGDIAPVSEAARIIVTVQMLADLALIGVILKVLIGAAQRRRQTLGPRRGRGDDGESAEGV